MPSRPIPPSTPSQAKQFTDAQQAVAYVTELYDTNTAFLREHFQKMASGSMPAMHVSGCYPYAAITTARPTQIDTRLAFGFVPEPGRYSTTLTRPDLFAMYYAEQFTQLLKNHGVPIEVGVSSVPIPIHFAFNDGMHVESGLDPDRLSIMRQSFDLPKLSAM